MFINEAAYAEKRIALSLTQREVWPVEAAWRAALEAADGVLMSAGRSVVDLSFHLTSVR